MKIIQKVTRFKGQEIPKNCQYGQDAIDGAYHVEPGDFIDGSEPWLYEEYIEWNKNLIKEHKKHISLIKEDIKTLHKKIRSDTRELKALQPP